MASQHLRLLYLCSSPFFEVEWGHPRRPPTSGLVRLAGTRRHRPHPRPGTTETSFHPVRRRRDPDSPTFLFNVGLRTGYVPWVRGTGGTVKSVDDTWSSPGSGRRRERDTWVWTVLRRRGRPTDRRNRTRVDGHRGDLSRGVVPPEADVPSPTRPRGTPTPVSPRDRSGDESRVYTCRVGSRPQAWFQELGGPRLRTVPTPVEGKGGAVHDRPRRPGSGTPSLRTWWSVRAGALSRLVESGKSVEGPRVPVHRRPRPRFHHLQWWCRRERAGAPRLSPGHR